MAISATGSPTTTSPVIVNSVSRPIPAKLANRIWKGEYIDMADLLPEALASSLSEDPSTSKEKAKKQRPPRISQIATWVECFSAYASVVVMQQPARTQDLLAYLSIVVNAARKYKGPGWQTYDAIFRQQAANDQHRKWADVNTSLWTTVFCNASPQDHCATCLSLDHTQTDCPEHLRSKRSGSPPRPRRPNPPQSPSTSPICTRFNTQGCTSSTCSFRHVCLECHGNHRRSNCHLKYRPRPYPSMPRKDRRSPSPPRAFRYRKEDERKNTN